MAPTILLRVATAILLSGTIIRHDGHVASAFIVPSGRSSWQQRRINRFSHSARALRLRPISVLYATPNDDDAKKDSSDSQSDGDMDLDQRKLALENMLKNNSDETDATTMNKNRSILTTSRKKRLEREIQLLKMLHPEHPENDSDYTDLQNQEFVISELWSLWYGERGPINQRKLHAIEEMLSDPSDPSLLAEAEKSFLALIREHCSTDGTMDNLDLSNWVEPANRYATLLWLVGRLNESKQWCERILLVKPWHIGALAGKFTPPTFALLCFTLHLGLGPLGC